MVIRRLNVVGTAGSSANVRLRMFGLRFTIAELVLVIVLLFLVWKLYAPSDKSPVCTMQEGGHTTREASP